MTIETCPGSNDPIDGPVCLLESFERFGAVLCDPCFEARCHGSDTPPTDDAPDDWAAIIPY